MLEHGEDECERREQLQHIMKTDPDPRVRRRAHALLLVGEGHTQASITLRVYAHVTPHMQQAAVAVMDSLFDAEAP